MKLKLLGILILSCICGLSTSAQKRKELKKYHVKTITETRTEEGKTIVEEKNVIDKNGNLIEKINYNKEGLVKSTFKYAYNASDDVVMEEEFGSDGKLKERKVYIYNGLGEKMEEHIFGSDLKLQKKHVYVYDAKGFKIERKTIDANGQLKATKKYVYTF